MVLVAVKGRWCFLLGALEQPQPGALSGVLRLALELTTSPRATGGAFTRDPSRCYGHLLRSVRHLSARGLLVRCALSSPTFQQVTPEYITTPWRRAGLCCLLCDAEALTQSSDVWRATISLCQGIRAVLGNQESCIEASSLPDLGFRSARAS